jgi:2'-5' RNA ligase
MRLFIAIDVSIEVVENLVLLQEDLQPLIKELGGRPKWLEADNIHLTLKFVGDIDPALMFTIRDELRDMGKTHSPFSFDSQGTGCFPNETRPRIVYAGIGSGLDEINVLREEIENRLEEKGITKDSRTFIPHISVGRIKTRNKEVNLSEVIAPYVETDYGTSQIAEVLLFESRLDPSGPIYRIIERVPLIGQ